MLVVHEVRLFDGLRGDGEEDCSGFFDLRDDQVHGFHLPNAEGAPAAADKAEEQAASCQQVGGADEVAIVVLQFELGCLGADGEDIGDEVSLREFGDCLLMDGQRLGGNVLRDQLLAFGVDLSQRTLIKAGLRFFERAPLHKFEDILRSPVRAAAFLRLINLFETLSDIIDLVPVSHN